MGWKGNLFCLNKKHCGMLMFEKPLYLQTIGIKPISYEHTKHIENL